MLIPQKTSMAMHRCVAISKRLSQYVLGSCLAFMLCFSASGQGLLKYVNPNFIPNTGKEPKWFKMLKSNTVDMEELEEEVEEYLLETYGKKLGIYDEEALEKAHIFDPYVFVYHRWKTNVLHAVDAKGMLYIAALEKTKFTPTTPSLERTAAASSWTSMGPLDIYSTANSGNQQRVPLAGNIFKLRASKSNPAVVYCISETNNLFKSTDKGLHWTSIGQNYPFGDAREGLAIHPTNPNIVLVGEANEIHRSIDGGTTWSLLYNTPNMGINEIEFSETNPNVILVSSSNGIYRSADGGSTWTRKTTARTYDIAFKPGNSNIVYGVSLNPSTGGADFVKSTDMGANFTTTTVASGWDNSATGGAVIGVSPADPSRVYVANLSSGLSLFRSNNEGSTWTIGATSASEGVTNTDQWHLFVAAQGYYDFAIVVSATNADHLIVGTASARKSTDGGLSFPICIGGYCNSSFPAHPDIQDAYTNGTDTYIASDGGVLYSNDFFSTNAEARIVGINASDFWHMDQGWDEDILVGGRYHNGDALMYEGYNGVALGLGGAESPTGWVLHGQKKKLITDDAGNFIIPATLGGTFGSFNYSKYPNNDGYGHESSELLIDPRYYNHHYIGNGNDLLETWDGGKNFVSIKSFASRVRKMEIGRSDSKVLYVAEQSSSTLYRSADEGQTWVSRTLPAFWTGNTVDLALDPQDVNHIWASNYDGDATNKIYESIDGGQTWTNRTANLASIKNIENIRFAGGTNNGIYISTDEQTNRNGNTVRKVEVFYRDASMSSWSSFSTGLPAYNMDVRRLQIFFRDAKMRTATSNGIWESPLYDANFKPIAQPSVDKKSPDCGIADTFYFYDYSILKYAGASRTWSISPAPLYISSTTAHSPKVVFGAAGKYSVTLTVTDANGNVSTKTVTDMIDIQTQVDEVAGKALSFSGDNQNAVISPLNITPSNNITMMAWIKTDAVPDQFDGVVMGRSTNNNFGLQFKSNGSIGYEWNSQYWWLEPSTPLPLNKWTHVALVVTPTSGTIYMNGVAILTVNEPHSLCAFDEETTIGSHTNDRYFKGLIDEVAIYNKSMTAKEIREQMHLTKKPSLEPNLVAYYQMNESTPRIYNKTGCGSGSINCSRVTSTAPVGGGVSFTATVTSSGSKNFSGSPYPLGNTGLTLTFPSSGTYPGGDVVVSRLNVAPDQSPTITRKSSAYWIINNFGSNSTFSTLSSALFTSVGTVQSNDVSNLSTIKLYTRPTFSEGATWGTSVDNADAASTDGSVIFITGNAQSSFSKQVIIGFQNAANTAPTASITAPANNATFTAPATVNISATATDADGTVAKVEFFQGTTKLGEDLSSPYTYSWTNVPAGTYYLTARATDNLGATTTSTAISITVGSGNVAPTVSITAPANNATFTAPATVNITATATDADGTVAKVEFFQGTTKLGEDLSSPYNYSWTNVPAGTYSLTARATDNLGATTTSTAISITVGSGNVTPTASITAPANNATFTAPATVNITATATDADGTVAKVEFFQGTTKLGEDLSSPYTYSWTNVPAGTYSLTVRSTDNLAAVTTSTAVSITVGTSTANLIGPDCGSNNTTLLFTVNTSLRTNATSYNWYYTGSAQGIAAVSGSPYQANLTTGASFATGQVCVGINYSASPYYASYCKSITVCGARAEEVTEDKAATITPNPSSGSFQLNLATPAALVKVSNLDGREVLNMSGVKETINFGNQWRAGIYMVYIKYENGKVETLKIEKSN